MTASAIRQFFTGHFAFNYFCFLVVGLLAFNRIAAPLLLVVAVCAAFNFAWCLRAKAPEFHPRPLAGHRAFVLAGVILIWLATTMIWGLHGFGVWDRPLRAGAIVFAGFVVFKFVQAAPQRFPLMPASMLLLAMTAIAALENGLLPSLLEVAQDAPFFNRIFLTLGLLSLLLVAFTCETDWSPPLKTGAIAALTLVPLLAGLEAGSETTVVALVVGWATILLSRWLGKPVQIALLAGISIVPLLMPVIAYALTGLEDFFRATEISFIRSASADSRILIWKSALEFIAHKPFLGWGHDAFEYFPGDLPSSGLFESFEPARYSHPHNAFLQYWLEMGVVGALLVTGLLYWLGRIVFRAPPEKRPFLVGLLMSITVAAAISHGAWQSWWIGTLVALAVFAYVYARCGKNASAGTPSEGGE